MDMENKTPWEDLRKSALEHYEEASLAIYHWDSFVVDAIRAYQEPIEDSEKEHNKLLKGISKMGMEGIKKCLEKDPFPLGQPHDIKLTSGYMDSRAEEEKSNAPQWTYTTTAGDEWVVVTLEDGTLSVEKKEEK